MQLLQGDNGAKGIVGSIGDDGKRVSHFLLVSDVHAVAGLLLSGSAWYPWAARSPWGHR